MNFHTRASAFPEREIVFLSEDGSVEENFLMQSVRRMKSLLDSLGFYCSSGNNCGVILLGEKLVKKFWGFAYKLF